MELLGRSLLALLLVSGVLVFSSKALDAEQPARIIGVVVDPSYTPVVGAAVYGRSSGSTVSTNTDRAGRFVLVGFSGQTSVWVEAAGHPSCYAEVNLNPGDDVKAWFRLSGQYVSARSHCYQGFTKAPDEYDRYVIVMLHFASPAMDDHALASAARRCENEPILQ